MDYVTGSLASEERLSAYGAALLTYDQMRNRLEKIDHEGGRDDEDCEEEGERFDPEAADSPSDWLDDVMEEVNVAMSAPNDHRAAAKQAVARHPCPPECPPRAASGRPSRAGARAPPHDRPAAPSAA